ncbi:hypothetical protein AD998_14975 [bacterium 336/3]|nr:hypothetical protein AD998_14975 [bacterium 336/3]
MKFSLITILLFNICFKLSAQTFWGFNSFEYKDHKDNRVKKVVIKSYTENAYHKMDYTTKENYFDTLGRITRRVLILNNSKHNINIIHDFTYVINDNYYKQITSSIDGVSKKEMKDSVIIIKKKNIFEIKNYQKGLLLFYQMEEFDSLQRLIKHQQVFYNKDKNYIFKISPTLRSFDSTYNESSLVIKYNYLDSNRTYVKEVFGSDKNNYSEGYIHYQNKKLKFKDIKDYYPNNKSPLSCVQIYTHDSEKNINKVYRLSEEDFEKLQRDPNAKVELHDYKEYSYNEKGLIKGSISFFMSQTHLYDIKQKAFKTEMRKLVSTYEYEYW